MNPSFLVDLICEFSQDKTIMSSYSFSVFSRVIDFVVSEPLKRLSLCIYWVAVILVSVRRFYNISKNSKIERILLRKYYHLMAVLMFLPALIFQVFSIQFVNFYVSLLLIKSVPSSFWIYVDLFFFFFLCFQPKFLDLAFGAALAVFLVLEIIRVSSLNGCRIFLVFLCCIKEKRQSSNSFLSCLIFQGFAYHHHHPRSWFKNYIPWKFINHFSNYLIWKGCGDCFCWASVVLDDWQLY